MIFPFVCLSFIWPFIFQKLKQNYTFNHPDDDLPKAVKIGAALNLSKTDDTHEPNELNFSPTATATFEKADSKWRLSPKCKCLYWITNSIQIFHPPFLVTSNPFAIFWLKFWIFSGIPLLFLLFSFITSTTTTAAVTSRTDGRR